MRELAKKHLEYLDTTGFKKDYIILFDRGYPSAELISELERREIKYLMRFPKTFLKVKDSVEDYVINHHFKKESKDVAHKLRILNFKLENDKQELLVTNLFDESLTVDDFKELYNYRWGIETSYGEIKNTLEIENFTGKLPIAVMQDFYATLFLYNLISAYAFDIQPRFDEAHSKPSKNKCKINRKSIADELLPEVIKIFYFPDLRLASKRMKYIEDQIIKSVTTIRPGRHYERKVKHKSAKYSPNHKNSSGLS